ncbi:MAG: glycosyltransferase family 4 protein [Mycobacteriaceae bacterium]
MRVAIVTESFLPNINGVTGSVLRVLEHLARTGHETFVVAPGLDGSTEHEGTAVLRMPTVAVPRIASLPIGVPARGLTAALAAFEPDVIHLASPFVLGAAGLASARRLQVPAVAVYQTDVAGFATSYGLGWTARAAWSWTRRIHSQAARTLAPSTWAVDALVARGVPRVHRWGRGVDTIRFAPSKRSPELRGRWAWVSGGSADALVVGYVGRLAAEKHVERLAMLASDPRIRLVIVGDGPERAKLQRLLPGAVFTGVLEGDELARAYASMDVFVHPGEHETFCQTVQEALASGVPVIAPDEGGPRDLVARGRTGYLLPVQGFAEALPGAVSAIAYGEQRRHFALAARRSVLRRTWPAVCDELLGHYAEVRRDQQHAPEVPVAMPR